MSDGDVELQRALQERFERAIDRMQQVLAHGANNTFVLPANDASAIGIDAEVFRQMFDSLQQTNERLASGELTLSDISVSAEYKHPELYWWGARLYLGGSVMDQILGTLDHGADAVPLLMKSYVGIKPKVAMTLAAALIKIGASVIRQVDDAGGSQGVCISHPWAGPVPGWVAPGRCPIPLWP